MAGIEKEDVVTDTEATDGIGEASGSSSNPHHQVHGEVVVAELADQLGEMMKELEPETEVVFDYLRCPQVPRCPGGWKAHCNNCKTCQFNCRRCRRIVKELSANCKDFFEMLRSMAEEESAAPLMDGFIEGTGPSGSSSDPPQGEVVVEVASQLGEMDMEELEPETVWVYDYLRCPGGWNAHCNKCKTCQFNCRRCCRIANKPGKIPNSCKDFLEKLRSMAKEENAAPLTDPFKGTAIGSSSNSSQSEVIAELANQRRVERKMEQLKPPLNSRNRPNPHVSKYFKNPTKWQPKRKNMTPYQGTDMVFGYFLCPGGCKGGHCKSCKVNCQLCHRIEETRKEETGKEETGKKETGKNRAKAGCTVFCKQCEDYEWESRKSYANMQQKCAKCQMKIYPSEQRPLKHDDFTVNRGLKYIPHEDRHLYEHRTLHMKKLCQGCVKGGNCMNLLVGATGGGGCHKK